MSSVQKDLSVDRVMDWLIDSGYAFHEGISTDEAGVYIVVKGEKRYMPELLADVYKLLK